VEDVAKIQQFLIYLKEDDPGTVLDLAVMTFEGQLIAATRPTLDTALTENLVPLLAELAQTARDLVAMFDPEPLETVYMRAYNRADNLWRTGEILIGLQPLIDPYLFVVCLDWSHAKLQMPPAWQRPETHEQLSVMLLI
jgi:hypothetical protein